MVSKHQLMVGITLSHGRWVETLSIPLVNSSSRLTLGS
ncbi:hypothetical protein [Enterobacter phage 02_vB_Eclo_IJM]|nr:hypothetical protein [Enterobacter phage 02_vB_Eclo_IJM]